MDPALCLYKEKLKEALVLVPTMSSEKRVEAVAYWNDLAEQLQELIHKNDSNFNITTTTHNLGSSIEDSHPLFPSNVSCHTSVSTETVQSGSKFTTNLTTESNINPLKSSPVGESPNRFQEAPIDKSLFENSYLATISTTPNDSCKEHLTAVIDEKLGDDAANISSGMQTNYTLDTPDINCAAHSTAQVESNICLSSSNNANVQAEDLYSVTKHSELLTQVPRLNVDSSKNIIDLSVSLASGIYCHNADDSHSESINNQIISYLQTNGANLSTGSVSKLHVPPLHDYDNVIVPNPSGCPRTMAEGVHEIGNGQFDRGPKLFDHGESVSHYNSTVPATSSAYVSHRDDLYTHGDRPLQQIQFYSENSHDFIAQSYAFMNGKVKYLRCNTCNEELDVTKDLTKHDHLHTTLKLDPGLKTSESCFTTAATTKSKDHPLTLETIGEKIAYTGNNSQHTCEVCGKSGFSTKGNLKRHLRAHSGEKPFKCDYCDSCFTEKKSLKIHVRRHTGEKPYKCEICGKLFSQTGVLQSHMALHLNERKFDCHKCGKAFRQRSQLKLHLMRHDGVKRLECSTCKAKFLTKGDLERHCRIHTGERPYACKICNKTFTRQQSLNEHMNRHTGRRPYDCKYCDKTFSEMSACYKHAKTHKRQEQTQRQAQNQGQSGSCRLT